MYLIAVLQPAQWVNKPVEESIEASKGEVSEGFRIVRMYTSCFVTDPLAGGA